VALAEAAALRPRPRMIMNPPTPVIAASSRKMALGKPGTSAKPTSTAEAIISALGSSTSWRAISEPRFSLSSDVTRVTMKPAVMAMNSAGIWLTRPSPMVSSAKRCAASPIDMPSWVVPTMMPPVILTKMMISPAMASPLTNFFAPSSAP
jgi:hypothetical protein